MAPNVNDPHVHSLSLISSDSCTSENSRTNSIWRGRMSQGIVRYIIHLYCLAVQAGFYSDVVEC